MKRSLGSRYGKWALVAGASQGFGESFAVELARRGMNVVLVSRRGPVLEELASRLRAEHGVEVLVLALDLATPDFAETIAGNAAKLDLGVVIYNAAFVPVGDFVEMDEAALDHVVRVNVRGPLMLARALLPAMCKRGRGAFVFVSSLAGLQGAPRIAAYSASKAFNTILAEALWAELRDRGIDVSVCCAGAMPTPGYMTSTDRRFPGMLSTDDAAIQTLNALGRGPRFVPGWINRLSAQFMARLLPRAAAIGIIARNTGQLS